LKEIEEILKKWAFQT